MRYRQIKIALGFTLGCMAVFTMSTGWAAQCERTNAELIFPELTFYPLNDLGPGVYQGMQGGLYPNGESRRPSGHESAGVALAHEVQPLDANGNPDPAGKIVLISLGMSNTTLEFQAFKKTADADAHKNGSLTIVDGAQGGRVADEWSDPDNEAWDILADRLAAAGVYPGQVQAAWVKLAERAPSQPFPEDAQQLGEAIRTALLNLKSKYPSVKIAYLSSRIYAGYSTGALNPEPYAYQSGFAVKWLIEDQINGATDLNFDPRLGPVTAPWLAWGPYLWANGTTGRSDGLIWECSDFKRDGTHPARSGQQKVADALLAFLKTDTTAAPWFVGEPADTVQVTQAYWLPGRQALLVEATSSNDGAVLSVQGFGVLRYVESLDVYRARFDAVTQNPGTVTVVSTAGGTFTATVTTR